MERTRGVVDLLSTNTRDISQITGVIDAIAAQTGLLALNATIEAAHAGEAGRGFAIVAGEVKSLALQTTNATADIGRQIRQLQEASTNAAEAISTIDDVVAELDRISASVASAVSQQSVTASEISRTITEGTDRIRRLRDNAEELDSAAVSNGSAADQLLSSAEGLEKGSETLRTAASSFVKQIRAA